MRTVSLESLTSISRLVREEILRGYVQESCIATSKLLLQVLHELGIQARPIPNTVLVMNQPYAANVNRIGRLPQGKELETWSKQDNSYSVGLGFGMGSPDRWTGHLGILVTIANSNLLIDASVDQVNSPKRLLAIEPPVIAPVPEQFATREASVMVEQNQCLLIYTSKPGNDSFRQTPAWMHSFAPKIILERAGLLNPVQV
ncbi:hypothetical protein H6G89_08330 [Oscillatoria sp. FACHB-1407]|uniref:hypothetical protein n=1 Tax=Oscillatoria sp. FACHB-1407 TaxID=2692847 RepID=UPI00168745BC|nr:hypothetical protein [Oscillatoria sp. FACHB-1407]MBD2461047.1 hypothetical protein [Oscillatoria sp. FACHB-1407]